MYFGNVAPVSSLVKLHARWRGKVHKCTNRFLHSRSFAREYDAAPVDKASASVVWSLFD